MLLPQIARFEPGSPIVVTTPNYHPDFVAAAKRLNGRFVDGKWRFDARDEERVRFACTQVWGACEGDALAERLGYEPTREQLRDLETQIRAKLDEAAKPMVRIAVDYENDAETWWDNAKTAARREDNYPTNDMRDLPASCAALIGNADAVTVSAEEADAFRKWCEQIEGWRHGPEHAPHPFTFNDAD